MELKNPTGIKGATEDLQKYWNTKEWSRSLFEIDGIDDIYEHAALMVASGMGGYNLDGLGRLGTSKECNTKYKIITDEAMAEII